MIENKEALSVAVLYAGPALFRRAIMVQGGAPNGALQPARDAAAAHVFRAALTSAQYIHRCCGQLCGQLGWMSRKGLKRLGPEHIAQFLGMKKSFEINGLRLHDKRVTRDMPCRRSTGAVVEFPARAGIGFADD
jgi:hypothetical protein